MKKFLVFLLLLLLIPSAYAESIKFGTGTWVVGEDISEGHYKIKSIGFGTMVLCDVVNEELKADIDASSTVIWLDNKSECVLKDGLYLCVESGHFTFTPIEPSVEQKTNKTYSTLLAARHNAIFDNYNNKESFEVSVSAGEYVVGVDIPEGNWCIRYFDAFTKTVTIKQNSESIRIRIFSPAGHSYTPDKLTHSFLKLKDGDVVTIEADKGNGGLFFIPLAEYHIE